MGGRNGEGFLVPKLIANDMKRHLYFRNIKIFLIKATRHWKRDPEWKTAQKQQFMRKSPWPQE